MNSFKTIEEARHYATEKPEVTHIIEIAPGADGVNPFICAKCSADILRRSLDRKPMPEIKKVIKTAVDFASERYQARREKIKTSIPGLDELRESYNDVDRWHNEFNKMMEDEYNDGANPPKPMRKDQNILAARYPIAAAYLKAESWSMASHYAKSSAGSKAMQRIESGEDYNTVMAEMEDEWQKHCDAHVWD